MEFNDYYTVASGILKGDFDEYLDQLENAVRSRRKDMAPKIWEFSVGDKIRMVNTNPKYLNGAEGMVRKINRTKVVIDLKEPHGRFHRNITTPLSMIERV